MVIKRWTVEFCDCGGGFKFCIDCEMPCEHEQLCPYCRGWEWYPRRTTDFIDRLIAQDIGSLYRSRADAWASIEL